MRKRCEWAAKRPAQTAAEANVPTVPDVADIKRALTPLFNPPRDPVIVDVPELGYLMIDGNGAPDEAAEYPTTEFQQSFAVIYPVIYTINFPLKRDGVAVPILPLEALWWTRRPRFDMNVRRTSGAGATMIVADEVTPRSSRRRSPRSAARRATRRR